MVHRLREECLGKLYAMGKRLLLGLRTRKTLLRTLLLEHVHVCVRACGVCVCVCVCVCLCVCVHNPRMHTHVWLLCVHVCIHAVGCLHITPGAAQ